MAPLPRGAPSFPQTWDCGELTESPDVKNPAGKVVLGLVSSLTGPENTQRADATYVLTTNDGANIVVTERAVIPYVEVLFETGSSKYAYLNKVTAWATGTEADGLIHLNFWQVWRTFIFFFLFLPFHFPSLYGQFVLFFFVDSGRYFANTIFKISPPS